MSFRFEISACPRCGGEPTDIEESVLANAHITKQGDGSFDYAGESEICWDSQKADKDGEGRISVICGNCRHTWRTHQVKAEERQPA